jgi:uncharacterized membrane protein YgaE (UPF0421/DUF939 family)
MNFLKRNIKKLIGLRTIKTAFGAGAAIILAERIGLLYAVSAGIIVILSVQNTKKISILIAIQRFGSVFLALFIAGIIFLSLGFSAVTFGLYLLIFIPLAVKFKVTDGIVVSSVLVTHLLAQKSISPYMIKNEFLLMIVGVGIGILLNIYMPKIEGQIKEDQRDIEDKMRIILLNMARTLREHSASLYEEELFNSLDRKLKDGSDRAYRNLNNYLFYEAKYYVQYMEMRMHQFQILKYMRSSFVNFYMTFDQTEPVALFTERVAMALHEYNSAEGLLEDLREVYNNFKIQSLPKSREEFENRALLFQFLKDLEWLLEIKRDFKNSLPMEYIIKFWTKSS